MNEARNENSTGQMQDAFRIAYLIAGYLKNTLTDTERDELDEWVTATDENMRLFAELTDERNIEKGLKERGLYNADQAVELLKTKLSARAKNHRAKQRSLVGYGVAACLLLLAGLFIAPLFKEKKPEPSTIAQNDLLPGGGKAVLSLADGKQIVLDSIQGNILKQGGLSVINDHKTLSYQGQSREVAFHTLTTPPGSQYQLVLPDGSKVWLNAASSIRFPTAFTGKERLVDITGEAYFEVAHHADQPFRVGAKEMEVAVLGTHFNVNAYEGDEGTKTTLLEGSVRVANDRGRLTIKPGQQAIVTKDRDPSMANHVDLDEVMAWKNGFFEFKDEPIESIMREVARWYDADIKYEGKISYHFNASIERDVPVSKLLHFLELTHRVHFTIQGKTIIVKP